MSFILDALKKVDGRKGVSTEAAAGEIARSSAARKQRGRELLVMAAIAVGSAVLTAGGLVLYATRPAPSEAAAPGQETGVAAGPETRTSAPELVRESDGPEPEPLPETSEPRQAPAPPPPPREVAPPPIEPEAAPPEPEQEPEPEPSAIPFTVPDLVLQGTSILDGRPVAVISDQRVFEGDVIQGARILRIEERSVELEVDGRRFTLTL